MPASRIHFKSQGRCVPFFRTPDFVSASRSWTGLSFEEADGSGEPLPSHAWPKTTLIYVTEGCASLRWKHRGVWNDDRIEPGTVSILRRDAEIQSAVPRGAMSMMVLQLDGAQLMSQAPDDVMAIEQSLESAQVVKDLQLASILSAMRAEVHDGCRSGRLFAESISTAFLAYLAARYANAGVATSRTSLSPTDMRRLKGYIRDNLSTDISVGELAAMVGMSPSHFTRVFKASAGITPHQCVMRERVAKAKQLMTNHTLNMSRVGAEAGFASQSHFAKVFYQFTGTTPKKFRSNI